MKENLDKFSIFDQEKVIASFKIFENEIKKDAAANTLIKNAYHYIRKGNSRPASSVLFFGKRADSPIDCYNKAINLDFRNSAHAHYNKALYLLSNAGKSTSFNDSKYHLRVANFLIETYNKNNVLALHSAIPASEKESLLSKKLFVA